jgi:hypothetical protein
LRPPRLGGPGGASYQRRRCAFSGPARWCGVVQRPSDQPAGSACRALGGRALYRTPLERRNLTSACFVEPFLQDAIASCVLKGRHPFPRDVAGPGPDDTGAFPFGTKTSHCGLRYTDVDRRPMCESKRHVTICAELAGKNEFMTITITVQNSGSDGEVRGSGIARAKDFARELATLPMELFPTGAPIRRTA